MESFDEFLAQYLAGLKESKPMESFDESRVAALQIVSQKQYAILCNPEQLTKAEFKAANLMFDVQDYLKTGHGTGFFSRWFFDDANEEIISQTVKKIVVKKSAA